MSKSENKIELELAEFVAKLIYDVFDAVATSMAEQAQRHGEILQSASLDLREYALRYISDEQVETELAVLFPWENDKQPHGIFQGAPYQPGEDSSKESPPIEKLTGLKLEPSDYTKKRRADITLKAEGVKKIFEAVRIRLAATQHESLGAIVKDGLPKVVVDSGRILSKVTFKVHEIQSDEKKGQPKSSDASGSASIAANYNTAKMKSVADLQSETLMDRFDRTVPTTAPKLLSPGLKLAVKQADESAPQSSEKTVNVYGEIEITFKTVS